MGMESYLAANFAFIQSPLKLIIYASQLQRLHLQSFTVPYNYKRYLPHTFSTNFILWLSNKVIVLLNIILQGSGECSNIQNITFLNQP